MQDFRKLNVWVRAYNLALAVYKATQAFPKDELYGLTSQIRRCSVSIPANIAEGCGRQTAKDFGRFLQIAMGSASELECLLLLAQGLGYLKPDDCERLSDELVQVKQMLSGLLSKLKTEN